MNGKMLIRMTCPRRARCSYKVSYDRQVGVLEGLLEAEREATPDEIRETWFQDGDNFPHRPGCFYVSESCALRHAGMTSAKVQMLSEANSDFVHHIEIGTVLGLWVSLHRVDTGAGKVKFQVCHRYNSVIRG